MISEDQQQLINRALDGELTDAEEKAVQTLLSEDAEFFAEYESLRQTLALFDEIKPVRPPENLAARIQAALPTQAKDTPATAASAGGSGSGFWGLALAAVLVLGVGIFIVDSQFMDDSALNETELVGTLASADKSSAANLHLSGLVSIKVSAAQPATPGTVVLEVKSRESYTLYLEGVPGTLVAAAAPGEVVLHRDGSRLRISGYGGREVLLHYSQAEDEELILDARLHTATKQLSGTVNLRLD